MEICRICAEPALNINIFNNEMVFEQKKNVKIYMILNNFLYEKLYTSDENSSFICENCCENLYNSYTFMETVRNSERRLKESPPAKKIRLDLQTIKPSEDTELDIEEVPVQFEEIDDETFIAEPFEEDEEIEFIEAPAVIPEKKAIEDDKEADTDQVTFLDYVLEEREDNNQKYVTVRADKRTLRIQESYEFDLISHSDEHAIYSCAYCIKAFGNFDFLMNHLKSHICQICFKILPSYNELIDHLKSHQNNLSCVFCKKSFNQKSIRLHIKKCHVSNLPNNYSVLIE